MTRILKLITANGHGSGGHFYSCRTISNYLANTLDIRVSTVGKGRSKVIAGAVNFDQHFDTMNKFQFIGRIRAYLRQFDIIHAYDEQSLSVAILFSPSNAKIAFTKCGGPNYKYQVRCDNTICFSQENFAYQSRKGIRNLMLLPNRLDEDDFQEANRVRSKEAKIKILRIGRISEYYEKSLWSGLVLRDKLNEIGILADYTVIGVVESEAIYNALVVNGVEVRTERKYTNDAAQNINQYDIVIGTGRGAVEAIARRKIVYLATKSHELPVLLTSSNIEDAFKYNFSERTVFANSQTEQHSELASRNLFQRIIETDEWQPYSCVKNMYSVSGMNRKYKDFYALSLRGKQLSAVNFTHSIRNLARL